MTGDKPPAQITALGVVALAVLCATIVAVVWLLTS